MRFSFLSSISSIASRSPWSWGISFLMSFSNSEYVIIWSRRSLIPYVIVIFTSSEAVALAPKSRVLAGSGLVIGGAPIAGSVGAISLSDCGDQFVLTRERCWGDSSFTDSSRFALCACAPPVDLLRLRQRSQAPVSHTDLWWSRPWAPLLPVHCLY